ncbi:MAG: hypothetical protein M1838_003866 [Thelocarpon superellum]|nr:MAG: hypothetical protein M1838_003866 [Thelocarpon superellum]
MAATDIPQRLRPTQFEDLDDDGVFRTYAERLKEHAARNFVLDFNKEKAVIAFDLQKTQFRALLKERVAPALKTRWINVWAPNEQQDMVKILGRYYGFSPRLLSLMLEVPLDRPFLDSEAEPPKPQNMRDHLRAFQERLMERETVDEEKRVESPVSPHPDLLDPVADLNHYRLINEVWHFSSVDWGEKYLCLGFNSLHGGSSPVLEAMQSTDDGPRDVPKGLRLWSWLILCNDGTVISIYEDTFPRQIDLSQKQRFMLAIIRRNLSNVFRELSKAPSAGVGQKAISILRIRGLQNPSSDDESEPSDAAVDRDAPSLLFFYLFDDWNSTYGLVARKEQQYGEELDRLRMEMLDRPELNHIDRLHHIGRQLGVLRRIYQSYKLIIDRILDRQKPMGQHFGPVPMENPSNMSEDRHALIRSSTVDLSPSVSMADFRTEDRHAPLGVTLSASAVVRLERMRDRIGLYALSEIHECLDTKESLVLMAFNLISMKESAAIERLTRITILLAKVTILFLPVNLMTQYFSVQIDDLAGVYTANTYWIAFGVIMFLSVSLLFLYGRISGTVEGKVIYQSVGYHILDLGRGVLRGKWRRIKRA